MIAALLFSVLLAVGIQLPAGYEKAGWGITADQLLKLFPAVKIGPDSKYHYSEHMEMDPDVYVLPNQGGKRIEYYFFKGKLYKVFVVYDKVPDTAGLYNRLKQEFTGKFGKPHQEFQQKVFGLTVSHTLWENDETVFDLREGAGFIYQVRAYKPALQEKQREYDRKKAI